MHKIVQINSVCHSSTGRILCAIHALAQKEGFSATAYYGRDAAPVDGEGFIPIGDTAGMYWHILRTRLMDSHGLGSKRATRRLLAHLRAEKPDIIHLHNIHGYYMNYPLLFDFLKDYGVPVVWTLHDCWSFTGHCAYYDYVSCEKYRELCQHCPQKGEYPASLLRDASSRNYRMKQEYFTGIKNLTLVCPSEWLRHQVGLSYLNGCNVRVIPNGVDLSVFRPCDGGAMRRKLGIPAEQYVILGAASSFEEKRKGLRYFLEMLPMMQADEKLVLVGVSEKQMPQLPREITALKKTVDVQELVRLYNTADVFVNPTMEDNLPTVTMEAMACGTPATGFKTGGLPELVEGIFPLAQKGDAAALYQIIQGIRARGKSHYAPMCTARAAQKFDAVQCFKAYIDLYKTLLRL